MPAFTSDKRLCLNADKSAVVDCDGPSAAFVLCGAGGMVSAEDAERLGLTPPAAPAADVSDQVPEMKQMGGAPENKAKAAPEQAKAPDPMMTLGKGKD